MHRIHNAPRRFDLYRLLMRKRIQRILLVSSLYDAFVLEEDDTLEEQLWYQFTGARMSAVPDLVKATTCAQALEHIEEENIDLLLTMARPTGECDADLVHHARLRTPGLHTAMLVTDPSTMDNAGGDVDRVFLWQNDPTLLLALVKHFEDLMNVDADTRLGGVRVILLVEDSINYYSSFLPAIYKVLMDLARDLVDDGLNTQHKALRVRSRPKILLARTWEEAVALYKRYQEYVLGVITDVGFPRSGRRDMMAGFKLVRYLRSKRPDLPICVQSAEAHRNRAKALDLQTFFIDKHADNLLSELRTFLTNYLGFGAFIFRDALGAEVARAANAYEMLERLRTVPARSLQLHAARNDFSHWMIARGELTIARHLRVHATTPESDPEEIRTFILDTIHSVLREKQSDVITQFTKQKLHYDVGFMRIGHGSLGGKARGVAFVRFLLARLQLHQRFPGVRIDVPHTLVICSEEFDSFLDQNDLRDHAVSADTSPEDLREAFLAADVHHDLVRSLRAFLRHTRTPLAVRSSSILEDSQHLPLAGMYATYMLPNTGSLEKRLRELLHAVRLVWASTFGRDPKAYFHQTPYRIEEEKMAVVIQHLAGRRRGDHFYPVFSGVAQSHNFYPVSYMQPEEGVVQVALGLGRMVVEGGRSIRFNPHYPDLLPQFGDTETWLTNTQHQLFGLRVHGGDELATDCPDLIEIDEASTDPAIHAMTSVWDAETGVLTDSILAEGPRVVTLSKILKRRRYVPLCEILKNLLPACEEAMGSPVEIEFAVDFGARGADPTFSLLQLRPMISKQRWKEVTIDDDVAERAWCRTPMAQGNGVLSGLTEIVYVRRDTFEKSRTREIAAEVGEANRRLVAMGSSYVLIGFGRWGSSDPWMGIGVAWHQIAGVKVLIEVGLPEFNVEPSQGSHFFQNITSLGIACLSLPYDEQGVYFDWDWLESLPVIFESKYVRHARVPTGMAFHIDGKQRRAAAIQTLPEI